MPGKTMPGSLMTWSVVADERAHVDTATMTQITLNALDKLNLKRNKCEHMCAV